MASGDDTADPAWAIDTVGLPVDPGLANQSPAFITKTMITMAAVSNARVKATGFFILALLLNAFETIEPNLEAAKLVL